MTSPAISHSSSRKGLSWRSSAVVILLLAAFVYLWIVPLIRPRGDLLWGHYDLKDIYFGIPVAIALCCLIVVLATPGPRRRAMALRLTTLAISLLVMLVVIDAFYAFVVMRAGRADFWLDQAHISRRYSLADPELGFVRKPSVSWRGYVPEVHRMVDYDTDENGFRNPPGLQKADIVFIGDSFTEAAQVAPEQTYVQGVAKASGLTAVNLGRGAYGPQQELIVLRRYGLSYNPRIVVWQLFEGNDLDDAEGFAEWAKNPAQVHTSLKQRYFDNSLLSQLLTNTRLQEARGAPVTIRQHDGTAKQATLRYRYDSGRPDRSPLGMAETLAAIEAGNRLCESRGIRMLVVVMPVMGRVIQPYLSFDRSEDREQYLPEPASGQKDFSRRIEEFCGQIGCGFVDVFAAMSKAMSEDSRNPYIANDEHLDIRGHEVMTRAIAGWIN